MPLRAPPVTPAGFPQPGAALSAELAAELADLERGVRTGRQGGPVRPVATRRPRDAGACSGGRRSTCRRSSSQAGHRQAGGTARLRRRASPPARPAAAAPITAGAPGLSPGARRAARPACCSCASAQAGARRRRCRGSSTGAEGGRTGTGRLTPAPKPAPVAPPAAGHTRCRARGADLSEQRVRALYQQYVDAKRRQKESTAAITYEGIAKSIRDSSAKLREKHGKSVDFEVAVRDGKTILKPVIK